MAIGPRTDLDYTHRLLDFQLVDNSAPMPAETAAVDGLQAACSWPSWAGRADPAGTGSRACRRRDSDLTREPLIYPAPRALRLQSLSRGDEGFILGLGYSTQRGYARNHAFVGELRIGILEVEMEIPEFFGFAITIGEIEVTES